MAKAEGKPNKNVTTGKQTVAANVINQSTRNMPKVGNSAGNEKRSKSGGTISGVPQYS